MHRENYSDQGIPPKINPPAQMSSYDFRDAALHFKPQNNIENNLMQSGPIMHQGHQMYYQSQNAIQFQSNPYLNMMSGQPPLNSNYDFSRYYWMEPKNIQPYSISQSSTQYVLPPPLPPQPVNIVQRISGLIKSQLPALQAIMIQVSSQYVTPQQSESRRHYSKSPSRSRSKQRRKDPDSWLCRRCSFSNYDWRQTCKKCLQVRPIRNFIPGPEDWKCTKCDNINYARRMECNRCGRVKNRN